METGPMMLLTTRLDTEHHARCSRYLTGLPACEALSGEGAPP